MIHPPVLPELMLSSFDFLKKSFQTLYQQARLRRLFQEDPGVEGCCWFAKDPNGSLHVLAGVLRVLVAIILAPLYVASRHPSVRSKKERLEQAGWSIEYSNTPHATLHSSPAGGIGEYSPTGSEPKWMLEVVFDDEFENGFHFTQISWSAQKPPAATYNAISYSMSCARVLFGKTELLDPHLEDRQYSLRDRRRISQLVLNEYASARRLRRNEEEEEEEEEKEKGKGKGKEKGKEKEKKKKKKPWTEYVWLDEFCLCGDGIEETKVEEERKREVGHLADIFSGAEHVCVFCHVVGCEHVNLDCKWNTRLFTLAEILHARNVLILTRRDEGNLVTRMTFNHGDQFRRRIQTAAAKGKQWHLYAVMQHSTNAGAASWQTVIHSLVVEAIRRDEADNFNNHCFLGKGLNGLLPRRARLDDLGGKDGWQDLAWLLELNQGFYNAASLAAVCSLAKHNVSSHRWWGKPITPEVGNERLEPLVHAFPVRSVQPDNSLEPTLCVVHPKTLPIGHMLRRDSAGLYNNNELKGIKTLGLVLLSLIVSFIGVPLLATGNLAAGIVVIYIACILFAILDLTASTIYMVRKGWIYFDTTGWDNRDVVDKLKEQDPKFVSFTTWGNEQLCPKWDSPTNYDHHGHAQSPSVSHQDGVLIDLRSKVIVPVTVIDRPNSLIILALHGCGITCMLLNRSAQRNTIVAKVGMANLPSYVLAQSVDAGTVYIGGPPPSF